MKENKIHLAHWFWPFCLAFLLVLLFLHPIDADGDFYHHLNIGRYVWQNHALPHLDNLTFTANGREYISYAWLSGVLFYFIYSNLGAIGINILILVLAILTFLLLYELFLTLKVTPKVALTTLFIIAPVVATRWLTRPEIFFYPIVIACFLIDKLKNKNYWIVFLYPLMTLLLVNLYGASFPALAAILFLIFAANIWEDKFKIKREKILFYILLAACFPLSYLNGYGFKSLFYINLIPRETTLWTDWIGIIDIIKSPGSINFSGIVLWIYLVYLGYFTLLAVFSFRILRRNFMWAVLSLALLVPFIAIRQRTLAILLSAPFLALMMVKLQERSKWIYYIGTILSTLAFFIFVIMNPPAIGENKQIFPPQMVTFIKSHALYGRVFNTPRIGSFLSYNLAPRVQVYSDTRDDLFINTAILENMDKFLSQGASVKYLLAKYKIDLVVVSLSDGTSFRDLVHDRDWALIYFDGNYLVIVPRKTAIEKNLSVLEIDPYKSLIN